MYLLSKASHALVWYSPLHTTPRPNPPRPCLVYINCLVLAVSSRSITFRWGLIRGTRGLRCRREALSSLIKNVWLVGALSGGAIYCLPLETRTRPSRDGPLFSFPSASASQNVYANTKHSINRQHIKWMTSIDRA